MRQVKRRRLAEQRACIYTILTLLRHQKSEQEGLKRVVDELRAQNQMLVRTLRDIHSVLLTLTTQGAEQKAELFELRKRLTDFHEDTAGRYLMASGDGAAIDTGSSSYYYSSSVEDSEVESVCGQPIEASRRSSGAKKH